MADLFISYTREDEPFARKIVSALETEGFSVQWDRIIPIGQSWRTHIEREVREAKAAIVIWSERSRKSDFVNEEAVLARTNDKYLPVRIDDAGPPLGFGELQVCDLKGWNGNRSDSQWQLLVKEVRKFVARSSSTPVASSTRPSSARIRRVWKPSMPGAIMLVALILAAGGAYWYAHQQEPERSPVVDVLSTAAAGGIQTPNLAQLAFDALNQAKRDGNFAPALVASAACIQRLEPTARTIETQLLADGEPVVAPRNVGALDAAHVRARGPLNDVGACLFVEVAAHVGQNNQTSAKQAFEQLCAYPHALVWDPNPPGFFWNPREGAMEELRRIETSPVGCRG